MSEKTMNFDFLVAVIEQTHTHFQQQAVKAVNVSLTVRNYLIGFYIVEFEQNGEDRAAYGARLVDSLADSINTKGLGNRNLKLFRQFYLVYPELAGVIKLFLETQSVSRIVQSATAQFQSIENDNLSLKSKPTDQFIQKLNHSKTDEFYRQIIERISFTHLVELFKIEDKTKRTFYELLILKTMPSVTELKRQINSLAFERVGLSANTEIAAEVLYSKIEPEKPEDAVKSVMFFDFLGLKTQHLFEEKELETALLNHLQEFIHELGLGFCFEDRQKRILIDDEYYFADLVFYHRILKCHVIIELKVDAFKHEYLSQLNTYVAYYNDQVRRGDDNPAIGILLCTEKGKKLVEYATAGMENQLFVSKYMLQLPKKEELEAFIQKELKAWK